MRTIIYVDNRSISKVVDVEMKVVRIDAQDIEWVQRLRTKLTDASSVYATSRQCNVGFATKVEMNVRLEAPLPKSLNAFVYRVLLSNTVIAKWSNAEQGKQV